MTGGSIGGKERGSRALGVGVGEKDLVMWEESGEREMCSSLVVVVVGVLQVFALNVASTVVGAR